MEISTDEFEGYLTDQVQLRHEGLDGALAGKSGLEAEAAERSEGASLDRIFADMQLLQHIFDADQILPSGHLMEAEERLLIVELFQRVVEMAQQISPNLGETYGDSAHELQKISVQLVAIADCVTELSKLGLAEYRALARYNKKQQLPPPTADELPGAYTKYMYLDHDVNNIIGDLNDSIEVLLGCDPEEDADIIEPRFERLKRFLPHAVKLIESVFQSILAMTQRRAPIETYTPHDAIMSALAPFANRKKKTRYSIVETDNPEADLSAFPDATIVVYCPKDSQIIGNKHLQGFTTFLAVNNAIGFAEKERRTDARGKVRILVKFKHHGDVVEQDIIDDGRGVDPLELQTKIDDAVNGKLAKGEQLSRFERAYKENRDIGLLAQLPPAERDFLFKALLGDKFTMRDGGSGLGLEMVRKMTALISGSARLHNRPDEDGALLQIISAANSAQPIPRSTAVVRHIVANVQNEQHPIANLYRREALFEGGYDIEPSIPHDEVPSIAPKRDVDEATIGARESVA